MALGRFREDRGRHAGARVYVASRIRVHVPSDTHHRHLRITLTSR
ncbi:hypothetical protein C7S16_5739 [Burkholderia thailandensis]|uniref:Uncharacterized protein n=1 Tax=Burkholderia thailandensis TaxID=57975 RepID=A0AAW9CU71_BURTH|nr:hypothetical protein [Burkholderia thailandensis]MDW9252214.1 hypothetical protein [Burkholderia thailandensis]